MTERKPDGVRSDIVKALRATNTNGRKGSENVEDRRNLESWPIFGDIDTRAYTKRKMTRDDRLEGGAVAVLDQAMFGYGDKALARIRGGSDQKKVADEEHRLDVLQNELRDQYPTANIGARALGAIGPLLLGRKLGPKVLRVLSHDYTGRSLLALGAAGVLGAGYTYEKNKPRSGRPHDPRPSRERFPRKAK